MSGVPEGFNSESIRHPTTMKNLAYCYETQRWIEGDEAKRVAAEQLREELALLSGERGPEFLRFTGSRLSQVQAVSMCRERLAALG